MVARRVVRGLLVLAALLLAPLALYKGIELVVAERLGLEPHAALPSPSAPQPRATVPNAAPGRVSPTPTGTPRAAALVVRGLGPAGIDAQPALLAPVPLTLAVRPFTPFAFRISRAAPRRQKEVLIELGAAPELFPAADYGRAALGAVWWPVGLLATEAATALPEDELARAGLFLVETGAARPGSAPRMSADAWLGPAGPDRPLTHDPAVLLVDAADLERALTWLTDANVRPLFASEALITRLGTRAALPRTTAAR